MLLPKKSKNKIPRWLLNIAIIFFIASFIVISLYLIFEKIYQDKIYPNVWLGKINLNGKTIEQANALINNKINLINQTGIAFYYNYTDAQQNKYLMERAVILPTISSTESDFSYQIINFNVEKTINQAYGFGRNNNFFTNLKNKINALIYKQPVNLSVDVNEKEINKILIENFSRFEIPAKNAKLIIDKNNNFTISEEKLGKIINYQKAIKELKTNLTQLDNSSIQLFTKTDYPQIYKKNCLNIEAKAKQILSLAPLTLIFEKKQWPVNKNQLTKWLDLKLNPESITQDKPRSSNNKYNKQDVIISLNKKVVEEFLQNEIAPSINRQPINAKFEIKDGRVIKFQASRDGIKLNTEASFNKIEFELINNKQHKIELTITELKSAVHTTDVNNFGISEIIGTGESNFAGSPPNRRHNIKTGAKTLNGILIKPNEEFSLNKTLGEINAETGYLPELVIKGNKTIPEYGGGLCQIGTTMFRAALATGLPITMRRNHSYRVSYYEPAGTDATIYNPWPDMRFINDTTHYILIQSRIEGDNLYFDFWGTKDGRIVEKTEPTIYNIVKPGPTKYIETLDLAPGKKKCTENSHNGADAYFDYKVTYTNGEIKEKRFRSHYIPWQAVCLIGVEELSTDNKTATTTTENEIE